MESPVVGIFVADLHLSEKPPIARSVEENWLKVQARYVEQLRNLQQKHAMAPIFIAGDLFDRWTVSPYLLSNVLGWFYDMKIWAIPGNHDCPNHSYKDLGKSAYWTLVEAYAINHLHPGITHCIGNLMIHPFPFGHKVTPPSKSSDLCLDVALIHDYIWTADTGYEGADPEHRYASWLKKLKGYDVAVFGDNHKGFLLRKDNRLTIANCGTFMRRHSDERSGEPCGILLHSNGAVTRSYFDTSLDKFYDMADSLKENEKDLVIDLAEFANELSALHSEKLDYAKTVIQWAKREGTPDKVMEIILRCLQQQKS
jgi:DNA repair exonuclease SbcCD nuclease subunit